METVAVGFVSFAAADPARPVYFQARILFCFSRWARVPE